MALMRFTNPATAWLMSWLAARLAGRTAPGRYQALPGAGFQKPTRRVSIA
ncbi:exported protein of unknown function [Pararobbsia alpina]